MLFNNYTTFLYIAFFVVIYNLAKTITQKVFVRNLIIAIANVLILLSLVKEHTIIVLAVFSILVYFAGKALQKRNSMLLLSLALSLIISLFCIRNYPVIQDILSKTFLAFINAPILSVKKLGLSYILFRYIHWLVEAYRKKIHHPNLLSFVNYILFFPSILAGPIDTYNNFQYWIINKKTAYQRSLFFAGITRIGIGAFKTLILVPMIIHYATDYKNLIPEFSAFIAVMLSLTAYSAYIYLDFSGYSDMAIGIAYLIGIKTPENFNNPYFSSSLSEFWKRWHITFSNFLKLYVFKPIIALLNKMINPKYRLLVSMLAYLLTFAVCGIWHGAGMNFVYWGLWHGVGLCLNKLWDKKAKPHLPFTRSKGFTFVAICITFMYVTIGWLFFHYSTEQLHEIYNLLK